MISFDKCAWFKTKRNRDKSRFELIYDCILSAKSIESAMTMLSKTNIGSQDMPSLPPRDKEKPKQGVKKTKKPSVSKPKHKK